MQYGAARYVQHGTGRLVGYLKENNKMPVEQSAYRRNHATETALLRVISDLLNSMDKQEVTLLGLLVLSAAFDCVDHDILLSRLERTYGIEGLAIEWIRSYLVDRTQQVAFRGQLSGILRLSFLRPTRFRAWSTIVPALHGKVAGHHQKPRYEGALLCR